VKVSIIVFPGTDCDKSTLEAMKQSGFDPQLVWHKEKELPTSDLIVLPGGSSYEDSLRPGAIASRAPIMKDVIKAAGQGRYVLGVGNGFQILTEAKLLPGVIRKNRRLEPLKQDTSLLVANNKTVFTGHYTKEQIIKMPIAHKSGCYYLSEEETNILLHKDLVLFYYCSENGDTNKSFNPNGSRRAIAGVINPKKNILGMMPHPEQACSSAAGSTDGKMMFDCMRNCIK
jgi:phosphoribosylformylglycinamidine synthase subunit PurQ / glutaminase